MSIWPPTFKIHNGRRWCHFSLLAIRLRHFCVASQGFCTEAMNPNTKPLKPNSKTLKPSSKTSEPNPKGSTSRIAARIANPNALSSLILLRLCTLKQPLHVFGFKRRSQASEVRRSQPELRTQTQCRSGFDGSAPQISERFSVSETSIKQADSLQRNELFGLWLCWGLSGQRDPSHIASGSHIDQTLHGFLF